MKPTFDQQSVSERLFEPALRLLQNYCRHRRDTLELSDEQFLRFGFQRVLGHFDSGRDFLQDRQDSGEALARTTWFGALHSRRRAAMVAEVATRSYRVAGRGLPGMALRLGAKLSCSVVCVFLYRENGHA